MAAISSSFDNFDYEIAKLLKDIVDEHGLKDYNVKIAKGSMKGDGYLSIITAVEVSGKMGPNNRTMSLIVKSAKMEEAVRKQIPIADFFQQEIYMYNTVIPSLQQFLINKGLPATLSFAKCLKATAANNSEAVIMENLKAAGFKLWERTKPMNDEHVAFVMKEYGRLHGLSFAIKDQDRLRFEKLTESMRDTWQATLNTGDFKDVLIQQCNNVVQIFNSVEDAETKNVFRSFVDTVPELFKHSSAFSNEYAVILHGDCWVNNLLFKYDDVKNFITPTQVCFIDLQLARLAPAVFDPAYFFYACSSGNILDNAQHYMDLYYNSLAKYLSELGSNPDDVYPYTIFLRQWREFAKYSLPLVLYIIKMSLTSEEHVADVSKLAESGNCLTSIFDYVVSQPDKYNERVKNIIFHFAENGFL